MLDAETLEPIEDVFIYYEVSVQIDNTIEHDCLDEDTQTDAEGKFTMVLSDSDGLCYSYFRKDPDYILKAQGKNLGLFYELGKENEVEVLMQPKDGVVKFTAVNETNTHPSIYVRITNSILEAELGAIRAKKYPITLPVNGIYQEVIKVPDEVMTHIEWRYTYAYTPPFFRDSIYIGTKDTVEYVLKY